MIYYHMSSPYTKYQKNTWGRFRSIPHVNQGLFFRILNDCNVMCISTNDKEIQIVVIAINEPVF